MLDASHRIPGGPGVDQERRDASLGTLLGIRHGEHQREVGVVSSRDEVFPSVDDPGAVVATRGLRLDARGIRPRPRFGQGEARDLVGTHQRLEVLLALGLGAIQIDRRGAGDHGEDGLEVGQDQAVQRRLLMQQDLPEVRESSPANLFGHVQRPESELRGSLPKLQPFVGDSLERARFLDLGAVGLFERPDLSVDELADRCAQLEQLVGDVQQRHVHRPPGS